MFSGRSLQDCLLNQVENTIVRTVRYKATGEGAAISKEHEPASAKGLTAVILRYSLSTQLVKKTDLRVQISFSKTSLQTPL